MSDSEMTSILPRSVKIRTIYCRLCAIAHLASGGVTPADTRTVFPQALFKADNTNKWVPRLSSHGYVVIGLMKYWGIHNWAERWLPSHIDHIACILRNERRGVDQCKNSCDVAWYKIQPACIPDWWSTRKTDAYDHEIPSFKFSDCWWSLPLAKDEGNAKSTSSGALL